MDGRCRYLRALIQISWPFLSFHLLFISFSFCIYLPNADFHLRLFFLFCICMSTFLSIMAWYKYSSLHCCSFGQVMSFICICLCIGEDNAFALTLWDGTEFVGLWGCSGFESTHTGLPSSTSPKQRSSSSVRPRPPLTRETFLPFEKWNWFRAFLNLPFPRE